MMVPPTPTVPRRRPGFGGGIRVFFEGLGFVVATPSAWPWAAAPVATAMVLIGGLGALGLWGAGEAATHLTGGAGFGTRVLEVLFWAVALLLAVLVGLALAQPLSGWALERLVRKQERALGAARAPDRPTTLVAMLRSVAVNLLPLVVGIPIFAGLALLDFLVPPAAFVAIPLKFLLVALLVAYDFLDYPLSVRGFGLRARLVWIAQHFGAVLGFGLAAAAMLLVPCVGLIVLPIGVAGAARLVVEVERAR